MRLTLSARFLTLVAHQPLRDVDGRRLQALRRRPETATAIRSARAPRCGATAVSKNTRPVATSTRNGRSHHGCCCTTPLSLAVAFGIARRMTARKIITTTNVATAPRRMESNRKANKKKAATPAHVLTNQLVRDATREYAAQKAATAINPASVAIAACDAKSTPCSNARKTETGPDVSGRPAIAPLAVGPQRRPISVSAQMNNGVSASFIRSMSVTSVKRYFG